MLGLLFQGLKAPASLCPARGPSAPGPASSQENQLGSVCAAGPRWGFRGAASFPRAVGASELFLQFYPVQNSGWCGWSVKSWWHCHPHAAAAREWLESANFFFFPSLSTCFKAAELYLDYFPNLLFTALRPRVLFLQERGEFYVFG